MFCDAEPVRHAAWVLRELANHPFLHAPVAPNNPSSSRNGVGWNVDADSLLHKKHSGGES